MISSRSAGVLRATIYAIYYFSIVVIKQGGSQYYIGDLEIVDDGGDLHSAARQSLERPRRGRRRSARCFLYMIRRDFINLASLVHRVLNGYAVIYAGIWLGTSSPAADHRARAPEAARAAARDHAARRCAALHPGLIGRRLAHRAPRSRSVMPCVYASSSRSRDHDDGDRRDEQPDCWRVDRHAVAQGRRDDAAADQAAATPMTARKYLRPDQPSVYIAM